MAKHLKTGRPSQWRPKGVKQDPDALPEQSTYSSYLIRSILVLGVLTLFFPLLVDHRYYFPYVFLKNVLFRLAVEIMVLLYLLLALESPAYRPRLSRITGAFLAYLTALLVSSTPGVSVSAWTSWWGDYARMGGMIAQLHVFAYFFVLVQSLKREVEWHTLISASLFCGLLMGVTGILQVFHLTSLYPGTEDRRIFGATGNANFYAACMLLNTGLAAWVLSRGSRARLFPLVAKTWLWVLAALDVFLVLMGLWVDLLPPPTQDIGYSLPAVLIIAFSLHGVVIGWYLLRRSTAVGIVVLSCLALFYIYSMYGSQTRGALVGSAGAVLLGSILYVAGGQKKRVRVACGTLVFLVVGSAIAIYAGRDSAWIRGRPTLSRLASISYTDPSAELRLQAWGASLEAIRERPFFGWGLENYGRAFDQHFPREIYHQLLSEVWEDRAHNVILDVGTASGLVGLASYSCFYGLVFWILARRWFRMREPGSLVLGGLIFAYLFQGLFTFDTVNTDVTVYLVLAYVAWYAARDAGQEPKVQKARASAAPNRWPAWSAAGLAAAITLSGTWYAVALPLTTNRTLAQAIAAASAGKAQSGGREAVYRPAVGLFQRAAAYRTTGRYEARQEFANYVADLAEAPGVSSQQKIEASKLAIGPLEESIRQDPGNARHRMYLASLINRCLEVARRSDPQFAEALAKKSLDALEKAESLSPSRPQIFFERATTCSIMGSTDRAIDELKKGIELNPTVREPNVDLLCLYIAAGRIDEAEAQRGKIRELGLPLTPEEYRRVIRHYNDKKEYARMVDLYKEQLAQSPDDIELLPRLAATYRELGEFELARSTALRAAELSPKIKAELQVFLDSLPPPK